MALRVETDDGTGPWLADIGFGDHARRPLALDDRAGQEDPGGTFRIAPAPAGEGFGDLDVLCDGRPRLRLETRPRVLAGFRAGAWYHRTSSDSHFTRAPVCSRCTEDGRITLTGRKLLTTVGTERHETPLGSDEEVLASYREHFGVRLDRLPAKSDLR